MPDSKSNRGARDRQRVAGGQSWEVRHVAEKFNVSSQQVTGAIRAVGNGRKEVEANLKNQAKKR